MTEEELLISQSIRHTTIEITYLFSDDIIKSNGKEETVSVLLIINPHKKTYKITPSKGCLMFDFHNSSYGYRWGLIADLIKEANWFAQNYISNLDNNEANK